MSNIKNIKPSIKSKVKGIAQGVINLIQNNNLDLASERINVCKLCPLFKGGEGEIHICDPLKDTEINFGWLNKESLDKVKTKTKGCGCILESKSTVVGEGQTCPSLKWNLPDFLYLGISNKDYQNLQNSDLLVKFIDSVIAVGLVMTTYNMKLSLVKKLISHKKLKELNYVSSIKYINTEPYIEYILKDGTSVAILSSYLDGTYSLIVKNEVILSRENCMSYDINNLITLVLNPFKAN